MATQEQTSPELQGSPEDMGVPEQPIVSTDAKIEEVSARFERTTKAAKLDAAKAEQQAHDAHAQEVARYQAGQAHEPEAWPTAGAAESKPALSKKCSVDGLITSPCKGGSGTSRGGVACAGRA